MFAKAVKVVEGLDLIDGWTYRTEYLQKPKHNSLAYDRIPRNYLIIFDINTGNEEYMPYIEKTQEAIRVGLEIVPILYEGMVESPEQLLSLLDTPSILGGQKIEGVVIKNYTRMGLDKKALMGKYVSEAYKEVHKAEWKKSNPTQGDVLQTLIEAYKAPARWNKAVQHLREAGELEQSPRDIGKLIVEAKADLKKECEEEIKEALYKWAIPKILRGCVAGLPEWYKEQLLKSQFSGDS